MSTTDRVREYLRTADLRRATLTGAADQFGFTLTRLTRHLRNEGTSFGALLDDERKARCEALLSRNRRADVPTICRVTGYTGPASVTRAIARWFNSTLPQFRNVSHG